MAPDIKLALVNIIEDKNVYPLNLVCLATYLKEHSGFENTRIIDINWEDPFSEIKKYGPDIVGISSLTIKYGPAIKLAEEIKEELDIPVIIGGVHISTCPESMSENFDVAVIGEGEETLMKLVQVYSKHKRFPQNELKKINGIAFYANSELIKTPPRDLIKPLDKIPVPDVSFLNTDFYFKKRDQWTFKGKLGIGANIMTSRGCPYRCLFCVSTKFWSRVRLFSVDHTLSEIKMLYEKYGVRYIQVYDDLFTISKSRLKKLVEGMRREGLLGEITFACQSRANVIDDELCAIMKGLGVSTVSFGFESGSERMLGYLKGNSVTVEQNRNAVKLCKKHGVYVYGSLILGSPTETIEDMKKTLEFIDFLKENKADGIDVFVASPFPSTGYWEYGKENNRLPEGYGFTADFYDPENPLLLDESVTKEEFKEIYAEALEKISTFTQKRSIIDVLLRPKEPRINIFKKAILNPTELFRRRIL